MAVSSIVKTVNSQDRVSIDTFHILADVCNTAVRKPVGKVYAASQNRIGG